MTLEDKIVRAINAEDFVFGEVASKHAEFDFGKIGGRAHATYEWHEEDHNLEFEGHWYHDFTEYVADDLIGLEIELWDNDSEELLTGIVDEPYIMARI